VLGIPILEASHAFDFIYGALSSTLTNRRKRAAVDICLASILVFAGVTRSDLSDDPPQQFRECKEELPTIAIPREPKRDLESCSYP
jgi:hypothetical protein